MIKWGIVGLGNMGQKFANAIKETSNSRLAGVASLDKNKVKNVNILKVNQNTLFGEITSNINQTNYAA